MTMIGYFFWGFVLVLVLAAVLIRLFKKDMAPPEKSESQIKAETEAYNQQNQNNTPFL
ncbi:hypothetical protein [Falsibacillus pallidus]|uniref:hypothetical protein n=1 Tax=Falsibacillus pallidus TaxID=493781 RepID=UPI003D97813B